MLSYNGEIQICERDYRFLLSPLPRADGTCAGWRVDVPSLVVTNAEALFKDGMARVTGQLNVAEDGSATIRGKLAPLEIVKAQPTARGELQILYVSGQSSTLTSDQLEPYVGRRLAQGVTFFDVANTPGAAGVTLMWKEHGVERRALIGKGGLETIGWSQDPRVAQASKDPGVVAVERHPNNYFIVRMRDGVLIHVPADMIATANRVAGKS